MSCWRRDIWTEQDRTTHGPFYCSPQQHGQTQGRCKRHTVSEGSAWLEGKHKAAAGRCESLCHFFQPRQCIPYIKVLCGQQGYHCHQKDCRCPWCSWIAAFRRIQCQHSFPLAVAKRTTAEFQRVCWFRTSKCSGTNGKARVRTHGQCSNTQGGHEAPSCAEIHRGTKMWRLASKCTRVILIMVALCRVHAIDRFLLHLANRLHWLAIVSLYLAKLLYKA